MNENIGTKGCHGPAASCGARAATATALPRHKSRAHLGVVEILADSSRQGIKRKPARVWQRMRHQIVQEGLREGGAA